MYRFGQGTMYYPECSYYTGSWKLVAMDCLGKEFDSIGEMYFGNFQNNARFGSGQLSYKNGLVIEGNWINRKIYGFAQLIVEKQKIPVQFSKSHIIKINNICIHEIEADDDAIQSSLIYIHLNSNKIEVNQQQKIVNKNAHF